MNKNVTWWQATVLAFALQIVSGLVIFGLSNKVSTKAAENKETKEKLELLEKNKANKCYVDEKDKDLETKIGTKVSKEAFDLMADVIKDIKTDTRDIKNYILNKK